MHLTTPQSSKNSLATTTMLHDKLWFKLILTVLLYPMANAALNSLVLYTSIPLFLDSTFTGMAAVLGLPYGLATAILTNVYEEILNGLPGYHLPFALCGMATAVIVWLMVRRKILQTPLQLLLATVLVALTNSILGAIIATFVFGGSTGTNIDIVVAGFVLAFENILSAAFLGRMMVNTVDKAPAVFAAMLYYKWLTHRRGAAILKSPSR